MAKKRENVQNMVKVSDNDDADSEESEEIEVDVQRHMDTIILASDDNTQSVVIDPISSFRDAEEEFSVENDNMNFFDGDDEYSSMVREMRLARKGVEDALAQFKQREKTKIMNIVGDTAVSEVPSGDSPKAVDKLDIISSIRADSPTLSFDKRSVSPVSFRSESPPRRLFSKGGPTVAQDESVKLFVDQIMNKRKEHVNIISS